MRYFAIYLHSFFQRMFGPVCLLQTLHTEHRPVVLVIATVHEELSAAFSTRLPVSASVMLTSPTTFRSVAIFLFGMLLDITMGLWARCTKGSCPFLFM